jgi:hypothetical protein
MPVRYERDDRQRRLRFVLIAPVTVDELATAIQRQADEGVWRYGVLVDARLAMLETLDHAAIQELVTTLVLRHGPRGPLAVAASASTVAKANLYGVKAEQQQLGPWEVFWDLDDAERWLSARLQA